MSFEQMNVLTGEWKDNINTNCCDWNGKKPLDHLFQPHCIVPCVRVCLFVSLFSSFILISVLLFPNLLQMRQLGCFLNSTLRRMVRWQICVCRVCIARSVVLVSRHLCGTVVVHAGRLVVWQVVEAVHRRPSGRHGIHIVPSYVHGATLHVRGPIVATATL